MTRFRAGDVVRVSDRRCRERGMTVESFGRMGSALLTVNRYHRATQRDGSKVNMVVFEKPWSHSMANEDYLELVHG